MQLNIFQYHLNIRFALGTNFLWHIISILIFRVNISIDMGNILDIPILTEVFNAQWARTVLNIEY